MWRLSLVLAGIVAVCGSAGASHVWNSGVTPAQDRGGYHGTAGSHGAGRPEHHSNGGWHPGTSGGQTRDHHGRWGEHRHGGVVVIAPQPWFPNFPYPYPYPPYPYYPGDIDTADEGPPADVQANRPAMPQAFWYYCETSNSYYPYVKDCKSDWTALPISPPPPGAVTPLSYGSWEWCEEKKGFYPYVSSCPKGFIAVPVIAPHSEGAADTPPTIANWFYCPDPKGYLPYVSDCQKDWHAVPAVPPPAVKITVKQAEN